MVQLICVNSTLLVVGQEQGVLPVLVVVRGAIEVRGDGGDGGLARRLAAELPVPLRAGLAQGAVAMPHEARGVGRHGCESSERGLSTRQGTAGS